MFGIQVGRLPGQLTDADVMLADALRLYEQGLCRGCGQPAKWAYEPRNQRYFMIDPESPTCSGCALVEGQSDMKPGEKLMLRNELTLKD